MFITHDLFNITFNIDLLCDLEIKNVKSLSLYFPSTPSSFVIT